MFFMIVNKIDNDRYQVIHDGKNEILTLDEVMVLLSKPLTRVQTEQERMDEFWESEPAYPIE